MQAKSPVFAAIATLALAAAPMLAHGSGYISRGNSAPYSPADAQGARLGNDDGYAPDDRYATPDPDESGGEYHSGAEYGYGEVLEVQAIIREVREPDFHEVCRDQPVDYYHAGRPHSPAGTLIGALIGGVIGHAVAGGSHRGYHGGYQRSYQRHSTAAGAAVGAAIGYQSSRGPDHVQRTYQQRCQVERSWRAAEEVVGYDVTYRYRGEIYQTRSKRHPGESIPVRVGARPY